MLCVFVLYMSGGTYSLKSTLNDRFLRNFALQFYLQIIYHNSAENKSPKNLGFEPWPYV